MNGKERVNLFKVIEKMNLVNLTPDIDVKGIWIHVPEFNRPALQLTGFYDQFDNDRIQIIGNVEYAYLKSLSETERYERYMQLLSSNIPVSYTHLDVYKRQLLFIKIIYQIKYEF